MEHEAFTKIVSEVMNEQPNSTTRVLLGRFGAGQVAVLQGEHNVLVVASSNLNDEGYSREPCNLTPYDHTGVLVTAMTLNGPIEIDMYPSQNNDARAGSVEYRRAETKTEPIVLGVFEQNGTSPDFKKIPLATSHELTRKEGQGWKMLQEQQDLALHPELSTAALTELEEYLQTTAAIALRESIRVGIYGRPELSAIT